MKVRAWTLCICSALSVAAWAGAATIDDARELLKQGKFREVEKALEPELKQANPPADALKLSLEAAMRDGRVVTAESRTAALLKLTENKDADLLLSGARLAAMLGDDRTAMSRYLAYSRLVNQKSDDLKEALRFILTHEAYVQAYRRYVELFGATDESFALGRQVLARLIDVPDAKGALEIAVVLQESFPKPQQVSEIHRTLYDAAGSFTFGNTPTDRYLPPLKAMLHGYPTSTDWINAMFRGIEKTVPAAERIEMLLAYLEKYKKPVDGDTLGPFDALAGVEDEAARLQFGRRYLALEPIYAAAKESNYDRYMRVIFDRQETFLLKDKALVTTEMAKGFFETYKKRYDKSLWPTMIRYVRMTISDPKEVIAFYRANLAELNDGQFIELVRLNESKDLETLLKAHCADKPLGYVVRLRWSVLDCFNQAKDKAGLIAAVRDGLMIDPGGFDPNYLRDRFINSPLPTADEKLSLLKQIIVGAGVTAPMDSILQGMGKSKQKPEDWGNLKAFQDLAALAKSKPAAANPAMGALATLTSIPQTPNRPDARIQKTVQAFLAGYKGNIPGGEDQVKTITDLQVRYIFMHHFSHTRDNQDTLTAWAQTWSARMPAGDFWQRMTSELERRRYYLALFDIAPRYVELTRNGGGDARVWEALSSASKKGQNAPAPLGDAYARMGADLSMRFLFNRRDQFNDQSRQVLLDEMSKAITAGGPPIKDLNQVELLINHLSMWTRSEAPVARPSLALIQAVDETYRSLIGNAGISKLSATVLSLYRRNGYDAEAQVNLKRYLDAAAALPPVEKANALLALLGSGDLPREAGDFGKATATEPGKWLHTAFEVYLPALRQVPRAQWPLVEFDQRVFSWLDGIVAAPDHPLRPKAVELSLLAADMIDAGGVANNASTSMLSALASDAQADIGKGDWPAFNRRAAMIAEIVGGNSDPEGQFNRHVQPLVPLLEEKAAAEPLYAMLQHIERRLIGQEAFAKRMQAAKGQAATGITNLIPVSQGDPLYPIYEAAHALSLGQETQAWELAGSPAKIELLARNWKAFDERFVAWTIEQLRKQKGDSLRRALEFCFTVLLDESKLSPETAGDVLLTRGDIYRDMQNYPAARLEYEGLRNNDRYRKTDVGIKATYRLVELHVLTHNYADAEAMLLRMVDSDDINTQAEAYYLHARIEFQQGNYAEAADYVRKVKERVAGHVEAALLEGELKPYVRGGMDNPIVEIGLKKLQTTLVPGRPLILKLLDRNLSVARAGESIPVILRASVGKDEERINLVPSSSNRNLFQATIPTALGKAQPGNMILEVSGADTVSYVIDEAFQKVNSLDYPPKALEVRSDAQLQASSERILTRAEREQRELERRIEEEAQRDKAMNTSRDGRTVRPGSPIYVQVNDPDRDLGDEPDSVLVDLRTTSGDAVEKFKLTETGPHTGIFEAAVPTSIPLPRAGASDTDVASTPASMIRIGSTDKWMSRADAASPKWIEVDTMSSAEIASASVELPNIDQIQSVTMLGMLADSYEELASYPARPDASRGGLTLSIASDNRGGRLDEIRRHLRLAPITSQWQQSPAFDRKTITNPTGAGWLTTKLSGTFYLPEARVLELKFLNKKTDHLTGYVIIDGQLVMEGPQAAAPARRVELAAGPHTLDILSTNHVPDSRIALGYRTDAGDYAPLPDDWFSVEAHPELIEVLKPRGTIRLEDGKAVLTLNASQRLRKVRLVFNQFTGMSVSAGTFTLTDASDKSIVPVVEDFTQGLGNRTLEIAPGDEITVGYKDTLRLWDGEQVIQAKLNSSYHNGSIELANELVETVGKDRRITYEPARRVRVGDQLMIIVTDFDMDTTDGRDTVQVRVKSSSGHELTLKALETSPNPLDDEVHHRHTGHFVAVVKFGDKPGPDTLAIQAGDQITASYLDSENTSPGVPIERTFAINESGRSAPNTMVYRSSITMVEDKSLEAQVLHQRTALTKNNSSPVLYKPQTVALRPGDDSPDAPAATRPSGVISSVAAPLLWEVTYPKMALHQGSVLNVILTAESELKAAKREGREPRTLTVPMRLDPIDHLARIKGYPIQVPGRIHRDEASMLRDGVFAGVARLQIGSPGDPIDDLIVFDSSEDTNKLLRGVNPDTAHHVPTLLVSGSDVVHIDVEDPDRHTVVRTSVELRSQARMELLDAGLRIQRDTIHLGETFWIKVTDPDRDRTDERDRIQVAVSGSSGDRLVLTLSETLPHSGIFTTKFTPKFIGERVDGKLPAAPADDDDISVFFGEKISFSYTDEMPLDSNEPQTVRATGHIHLGSDAELATFTKQFKDEDIAVKTRFLMAEALFEVAKEHRKVGQADQARDEIARGKTILEEALRDYPNSALAAQGDYLLANLAQELGNYGEAISRYSIVVSSYPDSEYAPESQFKKALCYEMQNNFDQASEEYVKLTYVYPNSALVADATIRLGNHFYKQKDYKVAGRIFHQFHQKNPTHRLAPEALLLSGHCAYQLLEFKDAVARFGTLVESYPDEKDLRAEALYWLADSLYQENQFVRSYQTFKKLTWDYPDNKWSKFARGRLTDKAFTNAEETQ